VKIGSSSRKIEETASFSLAKDITVEKVSKALVPEQTINELKLK
jgi:beta-glucosidase